MQILIDKAQRDKHPTTTSVVSESMPHLKKGAIKDFMSILEAHGYWEDDRWNKTDSTYTFETGSKFEFFSPDQTSKVRGPRRERLFMNEASSITQETFDQLEVRTSESIWLDWNPVSEFWWYTDVSLKRDVDFMILTYKDNEGLDPQIIKSIETRKDNKNWWRVYGLGLLGESEGRIYKDWLIRDEIPHEARLERYGLDFGYTNDPTALIAVYRYNQGFILDEVIYQKGLSNKQIADILQNNDKALVIADNAEPKSIDEIISHGISIIPSLKGKGSVLKGIQYVQGQRISATSRSLNLIKEYRNYLWQTDREGKIINEPDVVFNHCFVGTTKILTNNGYKQINRIKKGDKVFTSKGFKRVLHRWNNGLKRVNKYQLQFGTHSVTIEATPEHKVKTNKGWTQISKLQSGMTIYLSKPLWEKSIVSTQERDTSQEEQSVCTYRYGKNTKVSFLKDFISIIKTKILGTTGLKILRWLGVTNISPNMENYVFKRIQYGPNGSKRKVFLWLKSGTQPQMELNGIKGTALKLTQNESMLSAYVSFAENPTKQETQKNQGIVIKTAKLKRLDVEQGKLKRVYDLTVKDCHEYFANNILVHNCMDALRYAINSLRVEDDDYDVPDDTKWIASI